MTRNITLLTALLCLLVVACACAGANTAEIEHGAGFWQGLLQGVLAPITFVISLFDDSVAMYEIRNDGGWYNFGFLLGVGCWHGGGGAAAMRRRRRREDQA